MAEHEVFRAVGRRIRAVRMEVGLTQRELGKRAGIGGKYVSEIERGTRDIPLSTLHAVVRGLGRNLDVVFAQRQGAEPPQADPLPAAVTAVARALAALPAQRRSHALEIVRAVVKLASR